MGAVWWLGAVAGWVVAGFIIGNFIIKPAIPGLLGLAAGFADAKVARRANYVRLGLTHGE